MKILITGVGGTLGQILTYGLKEGIDLIGTDIHISPEDFRRENPPYFQNCQRVYTAGDNYFSADLTEANDTNVLIQKAGSIDVLVHLAGHVSRKTSRQDIHSLNVNGSIDLIEGAVLNGCPMVIFSSSGGVYGRYEKEAISRKEPLHLQETPDLITEETPTYPADWYSLGKVNVERALEYLSFLHPEKAFVSLRIGCTRLSNDPLDDSELKFSPDSIEPIVRQERIWVYHNDLVQIMKLVIEKCGPGYHVFNVHSQRPGEKGVYISIQKAIESLGFDPQGQSKTPL